MHLHRFLMGSRWAELPAQTVLDEKVSRIIGNILITSISLNAIAAHVIIYQFEKARKRPTQ